MKNFLGIWDGMIDFFSGAFSVSVIVVCLLLIFAIMFISISKLRIISPTLAILTSTIVSCLLMIPTISAFNHLAGVKDIEIKRTLNAELKERKKRLEAEYRVEELKRAKAVLEKDKAENEARIARMTIDKAALKDQISTLEHAQLSVQSFERILELALLQTNIKQSLVRLEAIGETKNGSIISEVLGGPDYKNDQVLVIIQHDIDAKYGVNLNEIKISKIDGNTAVVSGIRPKFIGASKNKHDFLIHEIRRSNYKDSILSGVVVQNDNKSKERARIFANKVENEFQQKLSEGAEFAFMDSVVIQLSRNFIKVMLAPLYKNISFEDKDRPNSLPIMEYLRKELTDVDKQMKKLNDDDKTLTFDNEKFDTDVDEINKQVEAINKELEKLKKENNSNDEE